jgi:DNA-binding winged helix-turn-helix (wHTH) protein
VLRRTRIGAQQRVLSRDQLLNFTQGREAELFDRSIDLSVSRVRQRLRDDAREPAYIKTVRNEGYEQTVGDCTRGLLIYSAAEAACCYPLAHHPE